MFTPQSLRRKPSDREGAARIARRFGSDASRRDCRNLTQAARIRQSARIAVQKQFGANDTLCSVKRWLPN